VINSQDAKQRIYYPIVFLRQQNPIHLRKPNPFKRFRFLTVITENYNRTGSSI